MTEAERADEQEIQLHLVQLTNYARQLLAIEAAERRSFPTASSWKEKKQASDEYLKHNDWLVARGVNFVWNEQEQSFEWLR